MYEFISAPIRLDRHQRWFTHLVVVLLLLCSAGRGISFVQLNCSGTGYPGYARSMWTRDLGATTSQTPAGVDLVEPYRISPCMWLMLGKKGRICAGGPPIWEINRLSGWASAAPVKSQERYHKAHSSQSPARARPPAHLGIQAHPKARPGQQSRPNLARVPCSSARTHALTRNRRRGSGGPQAGRQLGTHEPPTHHLALAPLN